MGRRIEAVVILALAAGIPLAGGCHRGGGNALDIALVSAKDSEFTSADGEDQIRVRANLPSGFASTDVTWKVERGVGDTWTAVSVKPGAETSIPVSSPGGSSRYKGTHPTTEAQRLARIERQRLRYRITATAKHGAQTITSTELVVQQAATAAIRQEYIDIGLRHGAPPLAWFKEVKVLPAGLAYGDFDEAAASPDFMQRLGKLQKLWTGDYRLQWQLNSFYRNPAHNRFHISAGGGSGPVSNSWHQFGCAADIQTFPALRAGRSARSDTLKARQFWDALAQEALELDFQIEPRDKNPNRPGDSYSGVGHLHIEEDCLP